MNRPIAPLYAMINVTGVCNLKCKYCYYQPRAFDIMEWKSFQRVIDELYLNKIFMLIMSGGEPFTHPKICGFLRLAHMKFDNVIILSNGTILKKKHLVTIKEIIREKGMFPIQISIDSIYPHINEITRCDPNLVINNMRILSEHGATIVVSMVITKFNLNSIHKSIIFLSKYSKIFHLIPYEPALALKEKDFSYKVKEEKLYSFLKSVKSLEEKHNLIIDTPLEEENSERGCASGAPCQAAFSVIVIDPNLQVRPCDRLTDITIGDLSISSLKTIWDSKAAMDIVNQPISLCV
ncbi:MAG: radical SAM/SPASM domain-containing protein [Candidatus Hodarchaeota archaeon]